MKIALVHDYLAQNGGAEKVLKSFREIWPDAPIYVLFHDEDKMSDFSNVKESFISKFPFIESKYQWYLPLMPIATESHDLSGFDVVLSSSSAFSKGVLTDTDTLHISYCHTPTRYLWTESNDYIESLNYNRVIKAVLPLLLHKLRIWDKMSVSRVDKFISNSKTVDNRIKKYYKRDSKVIYPPVETEKHKLQKEKEDYFLAGGRIAAYKRFDLIVSVFNRLGYKLKIFGTGPKWWSDIRDKAKDNIEFLGWVDEEKKIDLLGRAKAFIHPQVEDFGITAIEAMSSGTPVIAYNKGGATETVVEDKTGVLFDEQTWESLFEAVLNFDQNNWDSKEIANWAEKFSRERFKQELQDYVVSCYQQFKQVEDQDKKVSESNDSVDIDENMIKKQLDQVKKMIEN